MRKTAVFFALILIVSTFASPAEAESQCEALSDAAHDGDSGKMEALIASGGSVNCSYSGSYVEEDTGKTVTYVRMPLHHEISWGHLEAVRLLLSHGANVNLRNNAGNTPLDVIIIHIAGLEWMGASDEEWEDAEEIERLIRQAGGVSDGRWERIFRN